MGDETTVAALENLQNPEYGQHTDVELHCSQQCAGAGRRSFVRLGHPAIQGCQAQLAAESE